jgi:hypothetical protein
MPITTSPKILFCHIPKTGGITFCDILRRQYNNDEIFMIEARKKNKFLGVFAYGNKYLTLNFKAYQVLPSESREKVRIFLGDHMGYGTHTFLNEKLKYLTFLREPSERVISLYYHLLKFKGMGLRLKRNVSLKEFVEADYFSQISNGQTIMLAEGYGDKTIFYDNKTKHCTSATLELALSNLQNHFIRPCITERFDECLLLLKMHLGWSYPIYIKLNVNTQKETISNIPEDILKIIKERNVYDYQLYNTVSQDLSREVEENKAHLSKELDRFYFLLNYYASIAHMDYYKSF